MAYHYSSNGTNIGLSGNNVRSLGSGGGADCSGDERESRSGGEERLDVDLHDKPTYLLEHLATFTVNKDSGIVYPADGMRRLLQLEKTTGIWSQKMQLCLDFQWVLIMDYETENIIERFPASLIQEPTAFTSTDAMELYNNILVFIVSGGNGLRSEMHIFQSQSVSAVHLVEDLKNLRNGKVITHQRESAHIQHISGASASTATVYKPNMPSSLLIGQSSRSSEQRQQVHHQHQHDRSNNAMDQYVGMTGGIGNLAAETDSDHGGFNDETSSTSSDKYERDVTVLNHCFDDIEKFIARLQHAAAASRELERRRRNRKTKKKDPGEGLLTLRTRPPHEKEFIDIFAKFKLSFNLLAKLKAHIHDPNAPELVHFLFTPLALIVEAASDTYYDAQLPSRVVNPLITREAINLLINCVTSKETELWRSLGDAWTVPRDQWKDDVGSYHPVFMDGWSPDYLVVDELEQSTTPVAMVKRRLETATIHHNQQATNTATENNARSMSGVYGERRSQRGILQAENGGVATADFSNRSEISMDSIERTGPDVSVVDSSVAPTNSAIMQSLTSGMQNLHATRRNNETNNLRKAAPSTDDQLLEVWMDDLQAAGAKIVIVTYPRTANNDKELSVVRGEYLEVLDDTRKWWKARNIRGQIAHVPHTIVAPYNYAENEANHGQLYGQHQNKDNAEIRPSDSTDWIRKKHLGTGRCVRILTPNLSHAFHEYAVPQRSRAANNISGDSACKEPWQQSNAFASLHVPAPPPMPHNSTANIPPIIPEPKERRTTSQPDMEGNHITSTNVMAPITLSNGSMQEELRNVLRMRIHRTPTIYIDRTSSSAHVLHWLQAKDFSPLVIEQLSSCSGEDILALPVERLEALFGKEGRRLASQLKLQKSISGYKTARSLELHAVLARARPKIEYFD